jgi:hypothetical protein
MVPLNDQIEKPIPHVLFPLLNMLRPGVEIQAISCRLFWEPSNLLSFHIPADTVSGINNYIKT